MYHGPGGGAQTIHTNRRARCYANFLYMFYYRLFFLLSAAIATQLFLASSYAPLAHAFSAASVREVFSCDTYSAGLAGGCTKGVNVDSPFIMVTGGGLSYPGDAIIVKGIRVTPTGGDASRLVGAMPSGIGGNGTTSVVVTVNTGSGLTNSIESDIFCNSPTSSGCTGGSPQGASGSGGTSYGSSFAGQTGNSLASSSSLSSGGAGITDGLNQIKNQFNSQSEIAQSQNVGDLILSIIRILIGLLMAITVLFIVLGGYQYVTSAGNEEQAKRGRRTLTYAIIGLVVVILSYVIVNTVSGAVNSPNL